MLQRGQSTHGILQMVALLVVVVPVVANGDLAASRVASLAAIGSGDTLMASLQASLLLQAQSEMK